MIKHNQLKSLEFLKEQEVCENTNQNYWIKWDWESVAFQHGLAPYLPVLSSAWQVPFLIGVAKNLGTLSPSSSQELGISVGGTGCQLFSPLIYNSELQSVFPGKYRQEVWVDLHLPSHIYSIRKAANTGTASWNTGTVTFTLVSS